MLLKRKADSEPDFPYASTVPTETSAGLTSVFGMGTGGTQLLWPSGNSGMSRHL